MQLRYYRHPTGNFGDDLNSWLWDWVAPNVLDDDASSILIGLGTILGSWFVDGLPPNSVKVVLGAGAGKRGRQLDFRSGWHVYGVRGPLTASIYGLPPSAVLTDPAMLLRDFPEIRSQARTADVGFMPHIWSTTNWDWKSLCEEVGIQYIDPHAPALQTAKRIAGLRRLITEAMHGAIVADAVRTPWVAVSVSPSFESFKWCDWGGSLGMPIFFHHLPDLYLGDEPSLAGRTRGVVRDVASRAGLRPYSRSRLRSHGREVERARGCLEYLARDEVVQLSEPQRLDEAIGRTYAALRRFTHDFGRQNR